MMPDTGGTDPVTGATYYGDVLSGRMSVGEALYRAAQTGYYSPAGPLMGPAVAEVVEEEQAAAARGVLERMGAI